MSVIEAPHSYEALMSPEIDLGKMNHLRKGESVLDNRLRGKWKFDPSQIELYKPDLDLCDVMVETPDYRRQMKGKVPLNWGILNFLSQRENSYLVPDSWKTQDNDNQKILIFWGTLFQSEQHIDTLHGGSGQRPGEKYVKMCQFVANGSFGSSVRTPRCVIRPLLVCGWSSMILTAEYLSPVFKDT